MTSAPLFTLHELRELNDSIASHIEKLNRLYGGKPHQDAMQRLKSLSNLQRKVLDQIKQQERTSE